MEVKWNKHVLIICDLNIEDKVTVDGFGYPLIDGKHYVVEEVFFKPIGSESCFMVKINGYPNPLDSNWLDKVTS